MADFPGRRIEPPVRGARIAAGALPPGAEAISRRSVPSGIGLAFAVEELGFVRDWADRRGLRLTVQLDHFEHGVGCEELLSLTPRGHAVRCVSLWRQGEGVALRAASGHSRLYRSVGDALAHWERAGGGPRLRLRAWIGPLLARRGR